MKMYSWKGVSFLTLLCVGSVLSDQVCSVVEHREMQADFTNCSRRYTEEHFNTEKGDTCQLVKSVEGKCGELWQRCHTSREVRRMRDLHISALVRQYGAEGGLNSCDVVKEYRQSGRTLDDPLEDVTCSDDKTMDIQTKFQTCSHSTATSVYQTIQDLTSVKIISDKLCKALTTIGTVCVKHLNECFAEDDVRQMRKSHLEEMKTFLLRITQEKVTNSALDNCKVMEYVENGVQSIIEDNSKPENGDDFVPPDNIENNDAEHGQDFLSTGNTHQEEATNEKNENIENIPKVPEVITTSPLQVKGARSAEFIETESTSHAIIEEVVESEDNEKDDVATSLPNMAISDEEHDITKNKKEVGDEVSGDDVASKQKVNPPEEDERLQYIKATGGGHRADSDVIRVAVICSLVITVLMGRI